MMHRYSDSGVFGRNGGNIARPPLRPGFPWLGRGSLARVLPRWRLHGGFYSACRSREAGDSTNDTWQKTTRRLGTKGVIVAIKIKSDVGRMPAFCRANLFRVGACFGANVMSSGRRRVVGKKFGKWGFVTWKNLPK